MQRPAARILGLGLLIGTLDLAFASAFWWFRGVTPVQIAQSIARGALGRAAYDGGAATAALGVAFHYFIATMFVVAWWLAARRIPRLPERPVAYGLAYGALLYAVMSCVVLPLSRAGAPDFADVPWTGASIAMHLLIGVICALGMRGVSAPRRAP